MGSSALWTGLEIICRILGISTAVVLCAVGIETHRQGNFTNLAVYILICSGVVTVLEVSYFVDSILIACLPCPPHWIIFIIWKKMTHLGGFQKFLYYTVMAVVCFLHPVLAWHAVIPGALLITTGSAYLLLSKKKISQSNECLGQDESYSQVSEAHTGGARHVEQTFTLLHLVVGRCPGSASPQRCVSADQQADSHLLGTEMEMQNMQWETDAYEVTSDKMPMIKE